MSLKPSCLASPWQRLEKNFKSLISNPKTWNAGQSQLTIHLCVQLGAEGVGGECQSLMRNECLSWPCRFEIPGVGVRSITRFLSKAGKELNQRS